MVNKLQSQSMLSEKKKKKKEWKKERNTLLGVQMTSQPHVLGHRILTEELDANLCLFKSYHLLGELRREKEMNVVNKRNQNNSKRITFLLPTGFGQKKKTKNF